MAFGLKTMVVSAAVVPSSSMHPTILATETHLVLNPKAIVFFWTFLPQFVTPGSNAFWSLTGLGVILAVLTVLWLFVYAGFISKLRKCIEQPRVQQHIERVTGLILIGLGIRIAIESRH